jgi:hypothetical protein
MKRCPACKFRFPDVHRVCDFDGTRLLADSSPPRVVPRRAQIVSAVTSPVLWASVLGLFVLSTTFVTAYIDATRQSASVTSPRADDDAITASNETPIQAGPQAPVRDSAIRESPRTRRPRRRIAAHARPRLAPRRFTSQPLAPEAEQIAFLANTSRSSQLQLRTYNGHSFARTETAHTAEATRQSAGKNKKDPKFVAVLKTTWRILKKPFRF